MATTALKGQPVSTSGAMPSVGVAAPAFTLVKTDLSETGLSDYAGRIVVMNIFPSLDTGVCAASVRRFNREAAAMQGVAVICVSMDLPFALGRFCGAEGIEHVVAASDFRYRHVGDAYGLRIVDGPMTGLLARAAMVIDRQGVLAGAFLSAEISKEPDYERILAAVESLG